MIQGISCINGRQVGFKGDLNTADNIKNQPKSKVVAYADSFVKQSTKSMPVLLGLTGVWTAMDKLYQGVPVKQALKQNFTRFFAPVLIVSSAILAAIDTKK